MNYTFTTDNTKEGDFIVCMDSGIYKISRGEILKISLVCVDRGRACVIVSDATDYPRKWPIQYLNQLPQIFLPLNIFPEKAQMVAKLTGVMPKVYLQ